MTLGNILSSLLCLTFPILATYAEKKKLVPAWLSSIVACYVIGILIGNLRVWEIDNKFLEQLAGASMVIGLPLLLFVVRIRESIKYAGSMLLSFALCCCAGLLCTGGTGIFLADQLEQTWTISGMLVGLYTGGTPNVLAIGLALDAPGNYIVLVQAADILLGGLYLLGLITFLPGLYAKFYNKTPGVEIATAEAATDVLPAGRILTQLGCGFIVVALTLGFSWLLTGGLDNQTVIILTLTTLSLAIASSRLADCIGNSYPIGEYFILVFSVALGLMADFRELAINGTDLLWFSFLALSGTTLLHLLLCKVFKIDRDTVILSSVAAFYGPVFVVQVAASLQNKRLLAAGIAVSLFGFGIGNYLGVSLAYVVHWFVQ